LAGIASLDGEGNRRDIYVHAKVMLIDDEWATIGSCNLHSNSLSGHTEMNASIWDTAVVRPLRYALLAEHLDLNTTNLNARAALQQFRSTSLDNRRRRDAKDLIWQGLAYRLDAATYGE
jgi:cardiolipin synthase